MCYGAVVEFPRAELVWLLVSTNETSFTGNGEESDFKPSVEEVRQQGNGDAEGLGRGWMCWCQAG